MNDKSNYNNGISAIFDGLWSKQTEKNATKYFTNSNGNSRQTDQLFCIGADFQCESNARPIHTAVEW